MTNQLTQEELVLSIGEQITLRSDLTVDNLIKTLLPVSPTNDQPISSVLRSFIAKEFFRQMKNLCRFSAKNYIACQLKNGTSEFIRQFVAAKEDEQFIEIFPTNLKTRMRILKENGVLGSLIVECVRVFNRLREKFSPMQSEDQLRIFLSEWFQSGFMTLAIWKAFEEWKRKGPTLANLRAMTEPSGAQSDTKWREFKRLLITIKTDNFVELEKMRKILDIFFAPPQLSVSDSKVKLVGRILYLSEWVTRLEDSIKSNSAVEVAIFAEDNLGIDCDLTATVWQGKNLIIVSKCVNVWREARIRLSGLSYVSDKRKAASAHSTVYRGADGRHGRPGESSGNLAILTTQMLNATRLTVELSGGRGENGEDGGDGCDGANGVGVTQDDLNRLVVSYNSLYRDSWSNFDSYGPPSNWKIQSNSSSSRCYIYRTYKDEHNRMMTYSFAADKGWTYSTYDLYLLIRGSNGTSGTSGGSNGVGGQGGYNGSFTVKNPETNEDYPIKVIKEGKSNGPNGENGQVGVSGKCGVNGNDLALIDRSAAKASKFYQGSADKKLDWDYFFKADDTNRLNGYRRYQEKESACFIKFKHGEVIQMEQTRANKAQEQTVRQKASEAVAKQSILISKAISEAESMFGKQSAFLADACEESAKAALSNEVEEEEEEATENVTEEVVVLRQKEETNKLSKYTPESEKLVHTIKTPELYAATVKLLGSKATLNKLSQALFDFFDLEFPPALLDSFSLCTLFQQRLYRQRTQSSLAMVLVSSLQQKIVNGKSYEEIKAFNATLPERRKQKLNLSRLRQKFQNISKETDGELVQPSLNLLPESDHYFGVKDSRLSERLARYTERNNVKKVVDVFFGQYIFKEADLPLLDALNTFLNKITPQYKQLLEQFATDLEWTDNEKTQDYLDSLSGWLIEDEKLRKEAEKSKEEYKPLSRPTTPLESDFVSFYKAVVADSKYWKSIVESVNRLISKNGEYTARFGPLPGSSMVSSLKNKFWTHEDKNIEQARYLIKIYYLAKSILTFNRSLYVYNAMMRKELGQFSDDINYFNNGDQFDNFLNQCAKTPIKTDGDECLKYMTTNGLNCAPFRYLLSLHLNVKLCSYRQVSFQTLKKIETMNSTAVETESIWLREMDLQPTGIAADKDIRELVAAQAAMISKYNAELTAQMASLAKIDFAKRENILMFVSYFPSSLQASACEWIESYIASTQDLSLIQLLYSRMWVDGCHLTLFELQSVLVMFTSLKELFHCDLNYLLLLANSAPQSKLVDVFLYLRLEYHLGHRFANESRIFNSIQSIQNSRYKSLLAVKLTDYHLPIDDEDLYKITLMLQNASNGAEQLEKIGLDEWVSIARKQKWSEIGYLLQQYGSIGYYLGLLDSKSFREEEKKMRELFDQTTIIPEKLVALYTQWIVTRESDVNIFDRLKMLFLRANHYPELELDENQNETKCQLATNELEQTKLLKWMLNGEFYETVHTTKDRSIDELVDKITGLHDSPEKAIERKESVRRIAELLKKNDTQSSASVYWLNKFDEALYKLKKKRLRDTQKMAILCAIEGGKRVLEQVNTGEGKSFIIAAIATIHLKTGKRYVDVITSSPVLAQRDSDEMSELYEELGLTVAHNCSEDMEERKKAYNARIVYGDIARFQRDYLLHTFYKKLLLGDRTQVAVIVDEVDNMLLDNGNNMLYLSHTVPGIDLLDSLLVFIQQQIHSPIFSGDKSDLESMQEQFDSTAIKRRVLADLFGHFSIEDLKKLASYLLSEEEIKKTYENLIKNKVIDADGYLNIHTHEKLTLIETALESNGSGLVQLVKTCFSIIISRERKIELPVYLRKFAKLHLEELIENCKQAVFLQPDTGYVVDVDRTGKLSNAIEPLVTIIDPNTGADLASSQWTGGLHQFLQLKHGCRLSPMSLKAVFVSNVAYLKRYEYINGLSGTLGSTEESKTLIQLYQADLIKIPTNKPKVFYEHVPVIAVVREQWIANIYDEICDQVIAKRAVLVICEDIKQLEYIHMGLIRLFEADTRASQEVKECFTHVTTYKREHDEFNFEDEHKFEPHRLIIATNLAGRGTDIKLSDQVIKAGGMHVIVSFMPKNCRIEEQAFGRAARCGQPGSGQIIAFAEPLANAPQPSVFQLKTFRDNAEVHRLQSLNNFYKYHTEIEESCLEIFHNYIDSALSKMYNSPNSSGTDDAALPTPSHVVYFTLLDEWALWLDSKAPLIKQCSIEYSDKLKQAIIESVEEFKENHAFEDENKSNSFEVAKSWIVSPQALLTIGIIQMSHKDGFREAEETFNRVLADGCEFAGEAFYYKACMRMRNFEGLRKTANSLKLAKKEKFKEDIEEAIEYFYKARTCFLHRLHRKEREASLVAQMIEKLPANNPKTSGYASQIKSITTYIQMILANIDYLLGSPSHQFMFAIDGISEKESKKIHDLFVRQGLISPTLLTGRSAEDWQIEPFRQKYKLQRNQIENMLKEIAENPTSLKFEKYVVLDPSSLIESCPLSTKSEFWVELESQHTLKNTVVCLFVQDQSVLSSKLAEELNKLEPFSLENPDDVRTLLRYSSQVSPGTLYKLDEVKKHLEDKSDELMIELNQLVSTGRLKLDKLAQIRIVPKEMTYFSRFDGITFDDLREYFRLDTNGAAWILNNLQENGVLELETVKMMRFTRDNDKWESHVRSLLKDDAKPPTEGSSNEFKLLYKNAGALQTIKNTSRILNVSKDVIKSFCKVPDDTLDAFYSYLENEKILEPYLYKIWRQNSKLNCSSLPSCIADHVDEFLADRFAYSFALENICMSLEEANKDATPKPSQVFLPENPFRDIAADLVRCGLAMPARICASSEIIEDIDFDGFENAEPIRSVVYSNRIKLYDQTDFHMELLPLASYARDQGFLVDSDLNSIISNGLKLVVARKKQTTSSFLLNKILAVASSCWNAIKFVANKIGSFCYSVVKFAINLPGTEDLLTRLKFRALEHCQNSEIRKVADLIQWKLGEAKILNKF